MVVAATYTAIETAAKEVQTSVVCGETLANRIKMFHPYTGLCVLQFMHLFPSIGSEPENLNYWRRSKMTETAPR